MSTSFPFLSIEFWMSTSRPCLQTRRDTPFYFGCRVFSKDVQETKIRLERGEREALGI